VLALVAAGALAVLAVGAALVVARRTPSPSPTGTSPIPSVPTAPPGLSPEEVKAALRRGKAEERAKARVQSQARRDEIRSDAERNGVLAGPRYFLPDATPDVVKVLANWKGQALRLQCVAGPEPKHLCDQLAAVMKTAGWNVTRVDLAADAGAPQGLLVEVATDADDATQDAADGLADSLVEGLLYANGPRDMPPGGGAALQMTVGTRER
jgi:hypothetical protein